MKYRNCYGGKMTEGMNTFNVCDLQINIKHVMFLQLDKIILMVDNDSVV